MAPPGAKPPVPPLPQLRQGQSDGKGDGRADETAVRVGDKVERGVDVLKERDSEAI